MASLGVLQILKDLQDLLAFESLSRCLFFTRHTTPHTHSVEMAGVRAVPEKILQILHVLQRSASKPLKR